MGAGARSQKTAMSLFRQWEVQERVGTHPLHRWIGTSIEKAHVLHLKAQEAIEHEDSDGGAVRTQEEEGRCKGIHRREPRQIEG